MTKVNVLDHLIKFSGMDNHMLLSFLDSMEASEFLQALGSDS